MEQGESLAIHVDPLFVRQAPGGPTSDLEQGEENRLALTVSCGKAPEPNGGLFKACADVAIKPNRSDGSIFRRRMARNARYRYPR